MEDPLIHYNTKKGQGEPNYERKITIHGNAGNSRHDDEYRHKAQKDAAKNFNNYNRFIDLNDKLYVKFRNKCFINDYNEKELSIKDVKDEVITYVYDNKEYEAYYKDDLYLLGSSPFTC